MSKHENRQTMETKKKDTCICEESFIDKSLLNLEILRGEGGALCVPPITTQTKKAHGE